MARYFVLGLKQALHDLPSYRRISHFLDLLAAAGIVGLTYYIVR